MGNYEHMAVANKLPSGGRSVLSDAVGPDAPNTPADLTLIARTLENAGLLDASAPSSDVRHQVFKAIHHVARTLSDGRLLDAPGPLTPGSTTERVFSSCGGQRAVSDITSRRTSVHHQARHPRLGVRRGKTCTQENGRH